jgi:hypothetical protein
MPRASTKSTEWSGKYGLDQYAQTFAEHNIEYRVRRNKLLKAIEDLTLCPAAQPENKHDSKR